MTITKKNSLFTTRAKRSLLAGSAVLLLGQGSAFAEVTMIQTSLDGQNAGRARKDATTGRPQKDRQRGAGIEHANIEIMGKYMIMTGVGSYAQDGVGQDPGFGTGQGTRLQGISMVCAVEADGVQCGPSKYIMPQLNDGDQDRDCMHPQALALPESNKLLVSCNYPPNNDVEVFSAPFEIQETAQGPVLNQLAAPVSVLANNNDDCADEDAKVTAVHAKNGDTYTIMGQGSCNGNGDDVAWIYNYTFNAATNQVQKGDKEQASIDEIERFRANMVRIGTSNNYLNVGTEGDNQPPRDGISASVFSNNLQKVSQQVVAKGGRNGDGQRYYSLMPHLGVLKQTDTEVLAAVSFYDRTGRRRRGKGSTNALMGVLKASADGTVTWAVAPTKNPIPRFAATHHFMCETQFGADGAAKPAIAVVDTSINGASPARMSFLTFDEAAAAMKLEGSVSLNSNFDNATVPNYYGNNPGTQGKNTGYCLTMANPNFGQAGAWKSDVKSFVVAPLTSRRVLGPNQFSDKLALDIAVVDAVTAANTKPPTLDNAASNTPNANDDENVDNDDGASFSGASASGCSVTSNASGGSFLAFLGLALVAAIRRRRRA